MKENRLWNDEKGAFGLPVQYMVALIVAGMSIAIISIAGYTLWKDMQVKEAVKEVDRIVKEAELMYNTADEGTVQTIDVNFPSGMKKAVFGSENQYASNHYYILMDWGENKSFYAQHVRFIGGDNGEVVLYGGIGRVTLKLIDGDGDKYVKIEAS